MPCTYSMTTKLDITALKTHKAKLYPALLYGITTIVNCHEEFRVAADGNGQICFFGDAVVLYSISSRYQTVFNVWSEFFGDYTAFCEQCQKGVQEYGNNKEMMANPNPPTNTFPVSMIPWTSFKRLHMNQQRGYGYLLPIFTLGKFYEQDGKYLISLSVQVHHAACNGFHLCRFRNELQNLTKNLLEPPKVGAEREGNRMLRKHTREHIDAAMPTLTRNETHKTKHL